MHDDDKPKHISSYFDVLTELQSLKDNLQKAMEKAAEQDKKAEKEQKGISVLMAQKNPNPFDLSEDQELFGMEDELAQEVGELLAEQEDQKQKNLYHTGKGVLAHIQTPMEENPFMSFSVRQRQKRRLDAQGPMKPLDLGDFERFQVGVSMRPDGSQIQWLAFPNKLGARVVPYDHHGRYVVAPTRRRKVKEGWEHIDIPAAQVPYTGAKRAEALAVLQRIANLPEPLAKEYRQ